ncbi:gamma-glutamylcyclotransferase family protein [Halorussus halophilus]|uniref:gamma-glutamylcyclotransferase family protein n=1 Tax=Halorussus halophilus TaxID=2650975 RepID=UPI001300F48A|nr:gamma-glutamylcyclotransferase family protein [Halorussus halophilus]
MDVFVYGTLTDPTRVARVVSEFEFLGAAALDGMHSVEGQYPTLAPGGSVEGRVLRTTDVEALDAYEGVPSGLYSRLQVPREDDDQKPVELYVGDPEKLGADASWPGEGSLTERVASYVREQGVVVRTDDRT